MNTTTMSSATPNSSIRPVFGTMYHSPVSRPPPGSKVSIFCTCISLFAVCFLEVLLSLVPKITVWWSLRFWESGQSQIVIRLGLFFFLLKTVFLAGHWWCTPLIPGTRISVSSRPAWSIRASARTGAKATEKPCFKKPKLKKKILYVALAVLETTLYTMLTSEIPVWD